MVFFFFFENLKLTCGCRSSMFFDKSTKISRKLLKISSTTHPTCSKFIIFNMFLRLFCRFFFSFFCGKIYDFSTFNGKQGPTRCTFENKPSASASGGPHIRQWTHVVALYVMRKTIQKHVSANKSDKSGIRIGLGTTGRQINWTVCCAAEGLSELKVRIVSN